MLNIEKDQKDNLLSQNSIDTTQINESSHAETQNVKQQNNAQQQKQQPEIIDPIEEVLKKNNIMPLLAVIDNIQLNRKIQDKPLISILATKFVPLQTILKDRQIQFTLDSDKRTPLHYAIQANDVKAVAWLIQKGNPNSQDNFGNTPILQAIRLGRRRCFLLCLKNKFYDQRAPIFAAMHNRHWQLRVLYGMKYDLFKYRDQQNKTSFQRALQYCSFDCAQFLVKIKPDIQIQKYSKMTQSKGLIRRLKKIQKQNSQTQAIKQILSPILLSVILIFGVCGDFLRLNKTDAYQNTKPFYLIILFIIFILYGLTYLYGTIWKGKVQYKDRHNLGQILMQPTYKTLEQICPVCVHFTQFQYDHCYKCGCCVEKFHFHSFVCVNKSNEVFWVLTEFFWLYVIGALLNEYAQFLSFNFIGLISISSFSIIKFAATLEFLFNLQKYAATFWILFLGFLFLYQLFYCISIFGMMCMRRKYQQVLHSQKYTHLYSVINIQGNFSSKQKKIFKRGFLGGFKRCFRNFFVYFFVEQ